MESFAGCRMLVVGGGDSALESAIGLASQPDTTVTLSYRGQEFPRVKERNQEKLGAAVAAGRDANSAGRATGGEPEAAQPCLSRASSGWARIVSPIHDGATTRIFMPEEATGSCEET
jgi:cation diffusion facilitator CzcD-associated flavoprotein CzcO